MSFRPIGLLLIALSCSASGWVFAQDRASTAADRIQAQPPDRTQLERRFESVGTLLERSSAARQIDASGEPGAREKHGKAREIYVEARKAFDAGDLARASDLLSDASVEMFAAVRLAAPDKVTAQKTQNDFVNKVESVRALLAAQKRISIEKPDIKGAADSTRQIEALLGEAQARAAGGQMDAARTTLERAYLTAKASIGSMRGGDTLVRSLNFASKEEEYHYELDRNDTHQLLIKLLLEDKQGNPGIDEMVRGFLRKAGQLRGQAEAAASHGDHAAAIQLLETSTAELVKAIRNAGVYIPG